MQEEGGTSGLPATYLDCKERAQPRPRWPPSGPFPTAKAELRGCPQEVLSARKTCWPGSTGLSMSGEDMVEDQTLGTPPVGWSAPMTVIQQDVSSQSFLGKVFPRALMAVQ